MWADKDRATFNLFLDDLGADPYPTGSYPHYLRTERLREVFACRDVGTALALLAGWISWPSPAGSRLRQIRHHHHPVLHAGPQLGRREHGLSDARSEATKHIAVVISSAADSAHHASRSWKLDLAYFP
jgi:hypothetical protein